MSEQNNPYGAKTTGHVWDDNLGELLNQPPQALWRFPAPAAAH